MKSSVGSMIPSLTDICRVVHLPLPETNKEDKEWRAYIQVTVSVSLFVSFPGCFFLHFHQPYSYSCSTTTAIYQGHPDFSDLISHDVPEDQARAGMHVN